MSTTTTADTYSVQFFYCPLAPDGTNLVVCELPELEVPWPCWVTDSDGSRVPSILRGVDHDLAGNAICEGTPYLYLGWRNDCWPSDAEPWVADNLLSPVAEGCLMTHWANARPLDLLAISRLARLATTATKGAHR